MSTPNTSTLLAQLRAVLSLTNTEIQVAETRIAQARTEAVRRELSENADNARDRAQAIEATIRDLGGVPELVGPFLGQAAAAVKAMVEQAQPFDEALLGDLTLEHQLLDRARYMKALATAAGLREVVALADRLITAHSATVDWLTTRCAAPPCRPPPGPR
jgi:ferritin-like metal-binding protein YciE